MPRLFCFQQFLTERPFFRVQNKNFLKNSTSKAAFIFHKEKFQSLRLLQPKKLNAP